MKKAAWTANDVSRALRDRHDPKEFALLFEVRSETGYSGAGRYADAVAMSLWPSRGLELHGFEIKVSRADWKKELERPEKAEPVLRFCDRWWLAVSDAEIVHPGELPPTWGLLARKGKRLAVVKEAPKLKSKPLERGFVASLLRAAQGQVTPEAELRRAHDAGYSEGVKRGQEWSAHEAEQLRQAVETFEKASGVEVRRAWEAKHVGEAVRAVLDGRLLDLEKRVCDFEAKSGLKIDHWRLGHVAEAVRILSGGDEDHQRTGLSARLEPLERDLRRAADEVAKVRGAFARGAEAGSAL